MFYERLWRRLADPALVGRLYETFYVLFFTPYFLSTDDSPLTMSAQGAIPLCGTEH